MKIKRAAIYTRVSTDEQNTKMQEIELADFIENRGWSFGGIFCDHGQSGVKENRPALKELMVEVRKKKIDIVVVWSMDRLARSLKQLLTLLEEFSELGVEFCSYKQQLDSTTPAGRLLTQLLGCFAEFEREMLRERVRSGIREARRKGKTLGRPPLKTFGAKELEEIRLAREEERLSIRGIAKRFGTTQWMVSQILSAQAQEN